ncbi:hypothetical protein ACFPK5_14760 [Streptomyces beijiangensis]
MTGAPRPEQGRCGTAPRRSGRSQFLPDLKVGASSTESGEVLARVPQFRL